MRDSNTRLTLILLAAIAAAVCLSHDVQGGPLAPGDVQIPVVGENDPSGGTPVAPPLFSAFTIPGSYSGELLSEVIDDDPSNPLGGLTFVYTLTNLAGSPNSIGRVAIPGFETFDVDASYLLPLENGAIAPAFADRNPSGSIISFTFLDLPLALDPGNVTAFLTAGSTSAAIVVQTSATAFQTVSAAFADGGTATADAYAPSVVPEPTTMALLVSGIGLLVGRSGLRRLRRPKS